MCQEKQPELQAFRSSQNWDSLEHRYFREVDFLDIMHSVEDFARKRQTSRGEAEKRYWHSKAYLDRNGSLLRLDYTGDKPDETYIVHRDGLPARAFRFKTGRTSGGQRVEDDFLQEDWTYEYDENRVLRGLVWHRYPDLEFRYGLHNEHFVYFSYEYDGRGLLRIYQRNEGWALDGQRASAERRVIYDRRRNELLKKNTVSRTAWVPTTKGGRKNLACRVGGSPPTNIEIPICQKCGRPLAFVYAVELDRPLRNQSLLSTVPIFYCFDCLDPIITTEYQEVDGDQALRATDRDIFPEVLLHLGRPRSMEDEEEAFIKLGGTPDWIQDEEYPTCEKCGEFMMFVSQINSNEGFLSESQALAFGDSGRLYTFVCCDIVTSVMQCY